MLLSGWTLATQTPHTLIREIKNRKLDRTHLVAYVEMLGVVVDVSLALKHILLSLKNKDMLVVEAALQALRLQYIRDTSLVLPVAARDTLVELAVGASSPSLRIQAALCLADFSFMEQDAKHS